jgi:NADPH-dependent curcumin reductase CurA
MRNRRVVLRSRPAHVPDRENFEVVEVDVPEPGPEQALVRNLYFSAEPAIRPRLDGTDTYMPPIGIGEPIQSPTLGRVVRSNHREWREGDILFGFNNWEDYTTFSDDTLLLQHLRPREGVPLSYYVGPLGGTGGAAYVGLHDIGRVETGETVVVSAAAGGVGSVAGQIARIRGCRVVGLVGSAEKAAIVRDRLRFDVVINYRETRDLAAAVRDACPDGVDLYFDNVGGATLDALLTCMNPFGRIVCCGMIATYNQQDQPPPVHHLWEVVARQLHVQGFLLLEMSQTALDDLHDWVGSGELVVLENVTRGIEHAGEAFCHLMAGSTVGKTLIELDLPEAASHLTATSAETVG